MGLLIAVTSTVLIGATPYGGSVNASPSSALILLIPLVLGLAATVFWFVQLIDVLRRDDADFRGKNDKLIWALVVIFLTFIGALVYFFCKPSRPPASNRAMREEYASVVKNRD